jgi:hypothetical protein
MQKVGFVLSSRLNIFFNEPQRRKEREGRREEEQLRIICVLLRSSAV